ncbi:hypothetical protein FQA39_LY01562 [Lamprigera yunnana]|nr:hypothetical protein FQA39_LY01562 [Lamprigera yunnana]
MAYFNDGNVDSPIYNAIIHTFENYGWYVLLFAIIFLYLIRKLQPLVEKYWEEKANKNFAAEYHKNSDLLTQYNDAQQKYVDKLQKKYEGQTEVYLEKQEKRRQEKVQQKFGDVGYRLGGHSRNEKSSLKNEYHPLMGETSSRSYRPQRKSPCSGGGCKK